MADIVEKLKEACVIDRHYGKSVTLTLDYDDYMEAADTITALRAENERLRAKIEHLCKEVNCAKYGNPDFAWSLYEAQMNDLRLENEKLRATLRDIAAGQVTYLPFIQTVARAALGGKDE